MTDEIAQLLQSLHLKKIAELLDEELARVEREGASYQDLLARLLRAQWHHQQESVLAYRIKQAGMPEPWTIESSPFKRQPGISARQLREFAELDFVPKAENLVFIGPTGVGKTGSPSDGCSRRCRTATVGSSCARRISSTRCTPHWQTARAASCSIGSLASTSW